MADSTAPSDSKEASLENGFDPPDVPSTKVSTESKDGDGDGSGTSKEDVEEKKSAEEVTGVVNVEKGLEYLKDGVDTKDVEEVKDTENEKSVEINDNVNEKINLVNTKDGEEKQDERGIKDLEDNKHGEVKTNAAVTTEENVKKGVGETKYLEGNNDENQAKDGEEKKDVAEANAMEGKNIGEATHSKGEKGAKEAKEGDINNDAVKTLDGEEEKGFVGSKNEEGKKVVEETKHDDDEIVVEEGMNAEVTEDTGGKNNLQALGNVKDNIEKNYVSDVKGTEKKQAAEGKVHKDDVGVEQLKYSKKEKVAQGINDDEQKRDLGGENDVKNKSKLAVGHERVKVKKKPKDIEKVEAKVGKNKVAVDENEETVVNRGLEDDKDDVVKEVHISEEEDAAEDGDDDGDVETKSSNKKLAKSFKRKRSRGQRSANKSEVKDKNKAKGKKESGKKTKELISTIDAVSSPLGSSRERPVRERKTVERLVEVIEKEPNKAVVIEKGRGIPLKDIPNVAYKLARRKPADLKFLHQTLFGRRGKVVDFKSNILQFSGFAWHETEEKQRAKIKEKLDKCIKDNLLDLCDLLDLNVSKTNTKKEEIIVKLVDFLEAPHATTDIKLAEREQSEKSRKRKRFAEGSASRSSGGTPAKRSRKKSGKPEGTPKSSGKNPQETEDEEEEDDTENGVPDEDDVQAHSESDAKENESSEASDDEGEKENVDESGKGKEDMELSPKKQDSAVAEKRRRGSNSKKVSSETQVKSPVKTPSSHKQSKAKKNDTAEKVFTRKKKKGSESPEASDDEGENEDVDELGKGNQDIKQSPKRQSSSISKKRKRTGSNSKKATSQTVVKSPVKAPSTYKQAKVEKDDTGEKVFTRKKKDADSTKKSNQKSSVKDNSSGKKPGKGKATGEERKSGPSRTDLRKTICEILKEVDFNTATFTDILKKLAVHYKMDLTPKKGAIKQMIQEELTKMADEADESEEEGEKEETGKEETPKPAGKKVKA
ncbi:glutamic acid-rich protein [Dendrobium catenatum]|uniref:Omega-hydroxypalmitate O-feruloyl transferase n=1 Tax=Dendrobium catenatum TaxID=906689 RepID=A0A2I0WZM5_9ASPA|nr:glutamic acid-rich protein [Dendrobium catenatum]PKU81116.1 omega-hydroxypalmitate O-feruloyl transferase [Dendrobium catenatum]